MTKGQAPNLDDLVGEGYESCSSKVAEEFTYHAMGILPSPDDEWKPMTDKLRAATPPASGICGIDFFFRRKFATHMLEEYDKLIEEIGEDDEDPYDYAGSICRTCKSLGRCDSAEPNIADCSSYKKKEQ